MRLSLCRPHINRREMILVFNAKPGPYMTEEGKYTVNHAWGGLKPNDFAAICLRLANAMICLCTIPFLGLLKNMTNIANT